MSVILISKLVAAASAVLAVASVVFAAIRVGCGNAKKDTP